MAKILGSQKIDREIAKIAETSNGYIMNGHYYNKKNMAPKPLEIFETFAAPDYLQTSQNAVIRDVGIAASKLKEKWTFKPMVVVDNANPKISYSFISNVNKSGVTDELTVIKVIEDEDKTVEQLASYHIGAVSFEGLSSFLQPINIMGQNSNWISVLCSAYYVQSSNAHSNTKIIIAFNKSTGEFKKIETINNTTGNSMVSPLIESEVEVYYLVTHTNGINEIRKFSYNQFTVSTVKSIETTSKSTGLFLDTIYNVEGKSTSFYYVSLKDTTLSFNKITIDTTKTGADSVVIESAPVVYNTEVASIPTHNANNLIYHAFVSNILGSKFLNIAIYSRQTEANSSTQNGIYTLRVMEDYSLVMQGFTKMSTSSVKGLLLSANKQMAICGTDQAALVFSFDVATSRYKLIETLDVQPYSIGLDLEDNIWLIDGNSNLHTFSQKVPTSVFIQFEKNGYSYEGKELNSSITIEAKNYQGNRIACQLELTIKGSAVFTSNNSKTIIESTDTSKLKALPIKIQGSGNISIYPKLILN